MKILFLLIFATISTSTDKFKHESIFESDEPNTKIDETEVKTANLDSTESAINLKYTSQSNKKSTSLFNKPEFSTIKQIETTTNNFSNEKLLDVENGTSSPETNFQAEITKNESSTKLYISTTDEIIPTNSNINTEKTDFDVSENFSVTTEYFVSNSSNIESPNVINNDNIEDKNHFEKNEKDSTSITNKINIETKNVTRNLKVENTTSAKKYLLVAPTKNETFSDDISTTLPSETKNIDLKKSAKLAEKYKPTTEFFSLTSDEAPTQSYDEATRDQFFYQNHLVKDGRFSDDSSSSTSESTISGPPSSTETSSTSKSTISDPPSNTETSSSTPESTISESPTSTETTTEVSSSSTPESTISESPTSTETTTEVSSSSTPESTISESPTSTETTTEETTIATTTTTELATTTTTEPTTTTTINPCTESLQVENVTVFSSHFSLHLNWSDPGCNFEYKLQWETSKHRTVYSGITINQTEYTITKLDACEDYKIYIAVHYCNNTYSPKEIDARTTEYMSAVEEINSGLAKLNNEKNLILSWTIPSNVQKCLKEYVITSYKDEKFIQKFTTKDNSTTFYNIDLCINNTYSISAHSEHFSTTPKNKTILDPELNDPPIYNQNETEIYDDFVITKWNFGSFICRPEKFKIQCRTDNEKLETITGEIHLLNNSLTAKIENVQPYTNYTCCGIISNGKDDSKCSEPGVFLTNSKAPDIPININISQSETNLEISWDQPLKWNGRPEGYSITTEFVEFNYDLPANCQYEKTFPTITGHVLEPSYIFNVIIPASKYRITIKAKSDGGWSETVSKEVNITEAVPEAPEDLIAVPILSTESKDYSAYFNLTWGTICKPNGQLVRYILKVWAQKGNYIELLDEENFLPETTSFKSNPYLKAEYKYTIQLIAANREFNSKTAKTTFIAPPGIPYPPNIDNLKRPNTSGLPEPWNSAVVYISKNIFDEIYGEIKYVSIIVAEPGCEEKAKDEYYNSHEWPKVASDNPTCVNESRAYEATNPRWEPFLQPTKSSGEVNFTLGENQSCNNVLDCNRPLKPSTTYHIKLRAFTSRGYRDSAFLYLKTEAFSDVPVGLIVGLIIGILAIAFIIAAVLFYTKGKLNFKNWPRMESANQISPAPLPVAIKKFGSHYEKMIENPGRIKNEFQLLSTISSDVTLSTKTALLPHNKKKNRYINILPYDQTRVQLASANENSSDYINASYIKGYSGSNEYIATQGPTEATCPTFWQMIIEQNVKLIVMLTQFVESGKDKCYKYFPDLKEEYELPNDIKIQCTEEEIMNVYNKRVFKVKKGNQTKKVTHMQFNLWPDFGVPDEVHYMLDFCETIKEIKLKKPSIIVMHCSAGVGRTGTLIAVDILLQNIRDKRKVDIFGTVLNLRKQRMTMVQSERQYEFLYKCMHHVITIKSNTSSKHNLNQICESNML